MRHQVFSELEDKIKVLSETAWYDRKLLWPEVQKWLDQFDDSGKDNEKLQCLFLLSNFMFFGHKEIREMLKSMYRDLYRYPLVEKIRRLNGDTKDRELIEKEFKKALHKTKFLGIGNPSESGTHLLYFFRQENGLAKDCFIQSHKIFSRDSQHLKLRDSDIERYIFIDDLSGSGKQAVDYSEDLVKAIKDLKEDAIVSYYTLFSTKAAIEKIYKEARFDEVKCIFELDDTYKCFEPESRFYEGEKLPIDRELARTICAKYDSNLRSSTYVLGYQQSQLLLGFYHNTPDNVPPIFWCDDPSKAGKDWIPIFQRYDKIYSS